MLPDPTEIEAICAAAHAAADAARLPALAHFRTNDLTADNKLADGFDPVTVADRQAEHDMRAVLARFRPNDAIMGEEMAATSGQSGQRGCWTPLMARGGFCLARPHGVFWWRFAMPTAPSLG